MNYKIRNKKIIEKIENGKNQSFVAKKYKISRARVGQILKDYNTTYYYCEKHNKKFTDKCPFCEIDNKYLEALNDLTFLGNEIKALNVRSRKQEVVRKRKVLITKLVDEHLYPLKTISSLLGLDRTTIMYLYKSYKQGRKIKKNKKTTK